MTIHRRLGMPAVAAAITLAAGLPAFPASADVSTLYVNHEPAAHCSDTGAAAGTQAQPYCTVQAAVDAAQPGQTVLVEATDNDPGYPEQVTVKHSGTPGQPITIKGVSTATEDQVAEVGYAGYPASKDTTHSFVLSGVHDVTIQNLYLVSQEEAVQVIDSARIMVDYNQIPGIGTTSSAVRLTGATTASTVSRNLISWTSKTAIAVDAGVTGAVITTNEVINTRGKGIVVTDAPGTVVTSNTLEDVCDAPLTLAGNSPSATIENNVFTESANSCTHPAGFAEFNVSAASITGTKVDYNVVHPVGQASGYSWGGSLYKTASDFATATGQGTHDLSDDPALQGGLPAHDSAVTDSGDATAPGVLTTDVYGKPRIVRDLSRPDHGVGGPIDRGAVELQAFKSLGLSSDFSQGPNPLTVTLTASAEQNWPDSETYSYDFGDGSAPVSTTATQVKHTYTANGSYTPKVTATGTGLNNTGSATIWAPVKVVDDGPLTPSLDVSHGVGAFDFAFDFSKSTSPWPIVKAEIDFGDGYAPTTQSDLSQVKHTYSRLGDFTASVKLTDQGGRTATVSKPVHVAFPATGFTPLTPTRVLDTRTPGGNFTRLGPGQSLWVRLPALPAGRYGDAAVLNVTAVDPDAAGFLSVRPFGLENGLPTTSNLNFTAGHNVANLVTVPAGPDGQVSITNSAADSVDIVVDALGYYQANQGDKFTALQPSRLLDTRDPGHTIVGPSGTVTIPVRGVNGVSNDATAVVLNLTSTDSTLGGYLTAYPGGTLLPKTSNVNFEAGQVVPNQVVVPIGADGTVKVYNHSGYTHVVADLFGYYSPTGDALFTPVLPTRLLDTRLPGGSQVGPGGIANIAIAGANGVPAGATAAVLNVTSTGSDTPSYFTLYPDGTPRPGTSNLNFVAGQTVPNHVTVPLGTNGHVNLYNPVGHTDAVADLFGYFTK